MIPDVITESGNVNFSALHLSCAVCSLVIALHTFEEKIRAYVWFCLFCKCLQRPWATTFWRTQFYRLALAPLLTTRCWPRASPPPHLASSTLLVSSSLILCVCSDVSTCVYSVFSLLSLFKQGLHKLINVFEWFCTCVCVYVHACGFFRLSILQTYSQSWTGTSQTVLTA